jgi:hypothetical protein
MDICLITSQDVGRAVNYGIPPDHTTHRHLPYDAVIEALKDESLEIFTFADRNYVIETKTYFLKRTPSRDRRCVETVQRVQMNHILELKPIR